MFRTQVRESQTTKHIKNQVNIIQMDRRQSSPIFFALQLVYNDIIKKQKRHNEKG